MKDFFSVFLMLLLIVTAVSVFTVFGNFLGYWGLIIFEVVIVTAIILLAIRYFRSRRR